MAGLEGDACRPPVRAPTVRLLVRVAVPATPIFVDSRIELFPTSVWDDYLTVSAGAPGWQETLDRWGVTMVVVVPDEQPGLLRALRSDDAWRLVHEDDDGLVFERA
jgi:hypothetical protein